MNQPDLFNESSQVEPDATDAQSVTDDAPVSTEIATRSGDPTTEPPRALQDMRQLGMMLPPEQMERAVGEYADRRKTFRDLIKAMLIPGIHFGYPPGCEPRTKEINGKTHVGVWNGKKKEMQWYPPEQWQAKPSLYKAGADFVCDFMGVIDEYKTDMLAWEQLGKPKDTFVMVCTLTSRATGQKIGEGMGARHVGQKGGDVNNAIKMAKKCAKVDAVLNGYGLADLFTQDLEDIKPPHDPPSQNPNAAKAAPRGQRVSSEAVKELAAFWRDGADDAEPATLRKQWTEFVCKTVGREFNVADAAEWQASDYRAVCDKLELPG